MGSVAGLAERPANLPDVRGFLLAAGALDAIRPLLAVALTVVAASCSRPAPDAGGGPIGPRTATQLEALLGEGRLSVHRTVAFPFEHQEEFAAFHVTPVPHLGTTRHALSPSAHTGAWSHHAWIEGANPIRAGENTNHRGYPTVQFHKTAEGPMQELVFVEVMIWLDVSLEPVAGKEWFSFVTATSYADDAWARTVLFNLDADGVGRLMHVPGQTQRTIDLHQGTELFPLRRWMKLSIALDYTTDNPAGAPTVTVWVDERRVSSARFNPRIDPASVDRALWPACLDGWDGARLEDAEAACGLVYAGGLAQVHLGLYAPPLLSRGEIYNDELYFYELRRQ